MNLLIYICYILYWKYVKIVMLVIRDNELRQQVLSEVTEVGEISLGKWIWLAHPSFPGMVGQVVLEISLF